MSANGASSGWLLLLARLPGSSSSFRVALWRRLRAAGATSVVNSVWVLPATSTHAQFFQQVRVTIEEQGGTAFILTVPTCPPEVHESIRQQFQADRAREYEEFAERCQALLDEIGKETKARKYTFAEMEEGEQDLEKLTRWLAKIQARDFFPAEHRQFAATMMARCRSALSSFSQAVYIAEGVEESSGSTEAPAPPD
jgi:hypothetical protein